MRRVLHLVSEIVKIFHELLNIIISLFYPNASDKFMHLIVIGVIGIIIFIITNIIFKWLAKFSIELLSFVFTLSIIIVLTFSIEIQQYITGSGNMEFSDIVYGIWGFIIAMIFYYVIIYLAKKVIKILK